MRGLIVFVVGAAVSGTFFCVSFIELLLTIRRRKAQAELDQHIKELKASYNEQLNRVVLEDEAKLEELEEKATNEVSTDTERDILKTEYEAKLAEVTAKSNKAVDAAKAKAKKLEQEAKLQADEYLAERQQEVEEELMDLVLSVTKKVLPEGITYEGQKELVLQALRDVRLDKDSKA